MIPWGDQETKVRRGAATKGASAMLYIFDVGRILMYDVCLDLTVLLNTVSDATLSHFVVDCHIPLAQVPAGCEERCRGLFFNTLRRSSL